MGVAPAANLDFRAGGRMKTRPAPALVDDARILPTPERLTHDDIVEAEVILYSELGGRSTSKALAHRVRTQRIIDRLLMHETITETQHKAAERLWRLVHAAGMAGLAKVNPVGDRVSGGLGAWSSGGGAAEARLEASAAMDAVSWRVRPVVRSVVVDDMALRYIAARRGGTRAVALATVRAELIEGLDALVRFWRL